MAFSEYSKEGHHLLYLFMAAGVIVAGGLVLGYTNTNQAYNFSNGSGVEVIAMPYTGTCPTITCADGVAFVNIPAGTVVTGVDFDKAKMDYNTAPSRGLLAAGILAVALGGIWFIMCIAHMVWHSNHPNPCVEERTPARSGSMLRA